MEERRLHRGERGRRGIYFRRGARRLLSAGGIFSSARALLRALLRAVSPVFAPRKKIRRVSCRRPRGVRAGCSRRADPRPFMRVRAVRGDARGARRALSRGFAASVRCGARGGVRAHAARHEGRRRPQSRPRARPSSLRIFGGFGECNPLCVRSARRAQCFRRRRVRGHERLSHRARPHGPRAGDGAGVCSRVSRFGNHFRGGNGHSRQGAAGGRARARHGDALSLRDARAEILFRCGGRGDLHLARLFALSAPVGLRAVRREKEIRRGGVVASRGVRFFEIGAHGHRVVRLSRGRRRGDSRFSFLCSSREIFREGSRESTFPRQGCREERSRSSRGRA